MLETHPPSPPLTFSSSCSSSFFCSTIFRSADVAAEGQGSSQVGGHLQGQHPPQGAALPYVSSLVVDAKTDKQVAQPTGDAAHTSAVPWVQHLVAAGVKSAAVKA